MKRISYKLAQSVHYTPSDAHQAASLILLGRQYAKKDHSSYNWRVWLKVRNKWMKEQEKIFGKANLTCNLCGKTHLDPWIKNRNQLATIDHRIPVKRAPHLWKDPSNFQVACYHCNQKKGCS